MWRREIEEVEEVAAEENAYFQALNTILTMPDPRNAMPLLYIEGKGTLNLEITFSRHASDVQEPSCSTVSCRTYYELI